MVSTLRRMTSGVVLVFLVLGGSLGWTVAAGTLLALSSARSRAWSTRRDVEIALDHLVKNDSAGARVVLERLATDH